MHGDPLANGACVLCGRAEADLLFRKHGWPHVRCRGCGLISLRPLPSEDQLAQHHERSYAAGAYAAFAAADAVRRAVARDRLRHLLPRAPLGPWLDIGASSGAFVAEALAAGLDAQGIEVAATAVALARERDLPVHQARVEDFVPPKPLAVITAFDVVEHLPRPLPVLARLRQWLVPGGLLALTVPNAASLAARLLGRHWYYYAAPDHVHHFTPHTIVRLLEAAGLQHLGVEAIAKPLPLDYASQQLDRMAPVLAPLFHAVRLAVPRRWWARPLRLPLGEMLVTARPAPA